MRFNRRINLISRESASQVQEQHLLHTLALTYRAFPAGCTVVDWGTGGGLPSIPLAICFPEVAVHAVDAVGKKIRAVQAMGRRLGLENLHPWQGRAEVWPGTTHYSVSRATAPLVDLWGWHVRVRRDDVPAYEGAVWRPGLICLKGGDLSDEIDALHQRYPSVQVMTIPLLPLFERTFFSEKKIVEVFED